MISVDSNPRLPPQRCPLTRGSTFPVRLLWEPLLVYGHGLARALLGVLSAAWARAHGYRRVRWGCVCGDQGRQAAVWVGPRVLVRVWPTGPRSFLRCLIIAEPPRATLLSDTGGAHAPHRGGERRHPTPSPQAPLATQAHSQHRPARSPPRPPASRADTSRPESSTATASHQASAAMVGDKRPHPVAFSRVGGPLRPPPGLAQGARWWLTADVEVAP